MNTPYVILVMMLSTVVTVSTRQQEVQVIQRSISFSYQPNRFFRNDLNVQPDPPPKNETARMARYIVHYSGKLVYLFFIVILSKLNLRNMLRKYNIILNNRNLNYSSYIDDFFLWVIDIVMVNINLSLTALSEQKRLWSGNPGGCCILN